MLISRLFVAAAALGLGTVAVAQDFFDFGQIPGVSGQPAVQIDLNPTLLGFVSATTRASDPATADLLSSLDGVRVRVYKTIDDIDDVVDFIDEASARLERADWQQVVRVQDDEEVRIYIRGDADSISGLTAMVVGDEGAVFVNVAGSINPQQLGQLLATVGAGGDVLESLGKNIALNF